MSIPQICIAKHYLMTNNVIYHFKKHCKAYTVVAITSQAVLVLKWAWYTNIDCVMQLKEVETGE